MMSKLEKVQRYCDAYRQKLQNLEEARLHPIGRKRIRVISISDLHTPFVREDLVQDIIERYSGAEYLVINGDMFDCNLISQFPKSKEIPFAVEYSANSDIVRLAAQHFGRVILVDGNHDAGRFSRELGKLNPTIQFLIKGSPLRHLANGERFNEKGEQLPTIDLPNVMYAGDETGGWWIRIGKTIFAHRLRGFSKAPMSNAIHVANWFLNRGTQFQCLVSGHSHRVGTIPYRNGSLLIDEGALCYPMDYEEDGGCNYSPIDLGYAIVEMDAQGNVDPTQTRHVYLGTYQER
jgi:predicted phosphodiesterase